MKKYSNAKSVKSLPVMFGMVLCFATSWAQHGITSMNTSYISTSCGSSYSNTGAPTSPIAGNTYNYNYGNRSGTASNFLFLNYFGVGSNNYAYRNQPGAFVKIRRNNNSLVSGLRQLLWFQDSLSGSNLYLSQPYSADMEYIFNGSKGLNAGTDNIFCNTGDVNGNNNNIERFDYIAPSGVTIVTATDEGFTVMDRGVLNAHDPFCVAVITSLDGTNTPNGYSTIVRTTSYHYGTVNPVSSIVTAVERKDDSESVLKVSTITPADQGIGGIFFSYADFGLPNGTTIYGYSLVGGDFPTWASSSNLIDWTNTTYFPTNSTATYGGLDMIAVSGVFKLSPNVAPIATDITISNLCNPVGTGKVSINALHATDMNSGGSISSYTILTIPDHAAGILYCNNGASYIPVSASQTITPTQAATLMFDPTDGYNGSVTFTYLATDSYNLISNTANYTIPVVRPATLNAGPGAAVCAGNSATLSATGGVSYNWSPATGVFSTTSASTSATPTVTTTYTVTTTDSNGCMNVANVTVTVNPLPTISAGVNKIICNGASSTLTATGGVSYVWSTASGLSCVSCSAPLASPGLTTSYTVTGTDVNGCANTANVLVSVNASPAISAGAGSSICRNASTTLNASGGVSYSWAPASGLSCATCAAVTATPSVTTTYTVTGTGANGCTSNAGVTVTVNQLPNISAGSGTSICTGTSTALAATGGVSYNWIPASGLSCTSCAAPSANPTVTTTYTVIGTDVNGCINSSNVSITVNPLPIITVIASYSPCGGFPAKIFAHGAMIYDWVPAVGLSCTMCQVVSCTPSVTTAYTVTGTDVNGCSDTASITISVNQMPVTGFSINNHSQTLDGNSFIFTLSGIVDTANYSYIWNFGDSSTSAAANPVHSYTAAGSYNISMTVTSLSGGCTATYTDSVVVLSNGVGSGGGSGSGLESESLGGLVGLRDFGYIKNSVNKQINYATIPVFQQAMNNVAAKSTGSTSESILQRLVPATLNGATTPYITTPADITTITTAKDVFAVDYVENTDAKAVVLAITTLGKAYNHTKSICDRFRGATLLNTKVVTIQGYNFIQYALRQNNVVEYCIAFDAGKSAGRNSFDLQSNWLISQYAGDDSVFNFQAWAADPANTRILVDKMLTNLASIMPVKQVDQNFKVPAAYIASGVRTKGSLEITLTNNTPITSALLHFDERLNEDANVDNLDIPLTLTTGTSNKISIPIKDGYEYPGSLYLNGELVDVVYMADGNWSVDYDHSLTKVAANIPGNEPDRVYADNEYDVYRSVTLDVTTADYISAYKFIASGDDAVDLSAYHSLKFVAQAQGASKVTVRLIKSSITNWDDQYQTTVTLDQNVKNYSISFDDFTSAKSTSAFDPKDVTAVVYTFSMGGVNTNLHFFTGSMSFSPETILSNRIMESKSLSVFPNPNQGTFTCKFESDADRQLELIASDVTGRIVYRQNVQASAGANNVQVSLPSEIKGTGIYILSLGNENVKYATLKMSVVQ